MPITAFFGPYAPDLAGTLRTFGQAGAYYDANGHYARVSPVLPDFKLGANNTLDTDHARGGAGRPQDRPAAPLPRRRDPARRRQILAVHRQRTAHLRPAADALMDRRRRNSLAGSPLLIGAITTLIVVVAVFLSYNANNGLPFVPTYDINVELPEASGLQKSNQVRIGGTRVGVVNKMTPRMDPHTGRVTAIAELKLEKKVESLPANTVAIVAVGLGHRPEVPGTGKGDLPARR